MGLCKELEGHIFDYGRHGAGNTMRVTLEKIQQYVGIKFGEDIANEIKNKKLHFFQLCLSMGCCL
jgi:hypothetical protein